MILIYSKQEIKGVSGVYCDPAYFDGVLDKRATLVVTKDKNIQEVYAKGGIEVKGFPRTSSTPTQPKQEEKTVRQSE